MKKIVVFLALMCLAEVLFAQQPYIYTIKADSVKITNTCDTAELIIENHTQNVPGFLFNKGRGRTEFRRPLQKISDSIYLVGADSLKFPNAWLQGGNFWGTTGILGTKDNNHIDFYTNNQQRARLTNNGIWQIGNILPGSNDKLQVSTRGAVTISANLSRSTDRIQIGQYINNEDGQNAIIRTSNDNGATYKNILVERDGYFGLGTSNRPGGWNVGNPALRFYPNGTVQVSSNNLLFGFPYGEWNSSGITTYVSNINEWNSGLGNYPNRQNYYYFGTYLGGPEAGNVRANLKISGRELNFLTGAAEAEAMRIAESFNVLIGTTNDNGNKLQVNGSSYFNGAHSVTGTASVSNGGAHSNFYPTVTSTGADYSIFNGMRMAPVLNFSSNNQQAYALSIEPTFNTNGFSQNTDGISAALRVYSNWGGIKLDQHSSMPGNSGQPLFIEQVQTTNKEFIRNFRNNNLSTLPFIWNHDARPEGNKGAIVPALRSTITFPEAGGGISYTLDRYYWGTDASIDLKYETYPDGDNSSSWNTSIVFNNKSSGNFVTPMYLNGSKVGMGTSTPSAQLHTTGSVRFAGLTNNNSLTRMVVCDANGNLYYKDSSGSAFNGSLNSDLAVNGRVSAQKMLITQTGRWPDYVFSKQYQLPSLTEVENFIKQNNHLPGIPSAAEVEKKGIDVAANQATLLKKIEELTLYAIEQNKKLQKQEEEMAELKNQNKELELLKKQMAELKALIKK